jgi:hypothetical protein
MTLTDEQISALGLAMPQAPDPATVAASAPMNPIPPIMPSAPVQYPSSILGSKIPQGALIPSTHAQGKDEFQQNMPQITATPGTTDYFRQRQEQLNYKSEHPWGAPISAHPGALGSILHGLSVAGNIAGDIVDPGAMSLIPGTQLHNAALARGNEQGIAQGEKAENETAETAARTTAAGAEKEKADTEQQKLDDSETAPQNPKDTFEKLQDGSLVQLTTDPHTGNSSVKLLYKGDPKVETELATLQVGGKPHSVLVNKQSGETIKDLGETKEPNAGEPGSWQMVENGKNPDGSPHMSLLNSKTRQISEPVGSGAGTIQAKGTNAATGAMKTAAYRANTALAGIPDVVADIDKLSDKLGPVMGRWNEFMQGKVGADDPDFAGLRADMSLLSTAVTLAHAQGRMSEGLREEFDRMINQPKQTPQNIKATLGKIQTWMERQSNPNGAGAGNTGTGNAAPKATHVYDPTTGTVKPVTAP